MVLFLANSNKEAKFRYADPNSVFGKIWETKMRPDLDTSLKKDVPTALDVVLKKRAAVYHDSNGKFEIEKSGVCKINLA